MLNELDQPIEDLVSLAPQALAALSAELETEKAVIKRREEALRTALDRIFGDRITSAYFQARKDTGVIRVAASNTLNLKIDRDKTVEWNQEQLKEILASMNQDDRNFYAKVKVEVEAKKFDSAPPAIKDELAKARTVKPGRNRYTFEAMETA